MLYHKKKRIELNWKWAHCACKHFIHPVSKFVIRYPYYDVNHMHFELLYDLNGWELSYFLYNIKLHWYYLTWMETIFLRSHPQLSFTKIRICGTKNVHEGALTAQDRFEPIVLCRRFFSGVVPSFCFSCFSHEWVMFN